MAVIGIILAIIGIIITITLSEPTIRWFQSKIEKRKQKKWSADLLVDEVWIRKHNHYAYESWHQEITVDDNGNANHCVEACIINIGENLLPRIEFPIYCDAKNVSETEVQPWAVCGDTPLPAQVENWNVERTCGIVAISITTPFSPSERRNIRWGYRLPFTFTSGDEYYNWDIATPHFEIGGKIKFSKLWTIHYARWESELATTQAPPKIQKNTIRWIIRFPELGKRITMRFGLSKKIENTNKDIQI